jgi:hypothetical protein
MISNVNPDNLAAARKRQSKITEYRKMLLAWRVWQAIADQAIAA